MFIPLPDQVFGRSLRRHDTITHTFRLYFIEIRPQIAEHRRGHRPESQMMVFQQTVDIAIFDLLVRNRIGTSPTGQRNQERLHGNIKSQVEALQTTIRLIYRNPRLPESLHKSGHIPAVNLYPFRLAGTTGGKQNVGRQIVRTLLPVSIFDTFAPKAEIVITKLSG